MRMYELWKLPKPEGKPRRLEDAGGPVLFERHCDAEAYSWEDPDRWEVRFTILPVRVGRA
jgi:hypothetical protein